MMGFWTGNSVNLIVALSLAHCFGPEPAAMAFAPHLPSLSPPPRLVPGTSRVGTAGSHLALRPALSLRMMSGSAEEGSGADASPVQVQDQDWRKFRAKLISQEAVPEKEAKVAWERTIQRNTVVSERNWSPATQVEPGQTWAHEVAVPEPGCLIIARPDFFGFSQHYFREAVICLVQHDETGSAGFILNRPTPYKIGGVTNKLPGFENSPLYLGGDVGDGIQVMHGISGMSGSKEIIDGVMMGSVLPPQLYVCPWWRLLISLACALTESILGKPKSF